MTKKILTTSFVALILIFTSSVIAQDGAAGNIEEKLEKLKGNIKKITITTDKEEKVFEGKDAESLFKRLKKHSMTIFDKSKMPDINTWISKDDSTTIIKIMDGQQMHFFNDSDSSNKNFFYKFERIDSLSKKFEKIHKIKMDKGKKIIMIGDDTDSIKWIDKDDNFFILKEDGDSSTINLNVEVEKLDGEVKVIITEMDGENSKLTELTGEEAEEYLKKHNKHHKVFINDSGDEKIEMIIKKLKSENDDEDFNWVGVEDDSNLKVIKYTENDGTKELTISTKDENGVEKVEKYYNEEAEEKLKEFDIRKDLKELKEETSKQIIIKIK